MGKRRAFADAISYTPAHANAIIDGHTCAWTDMYIHVSLLYLQESCIRLVLFEPW